MNSMKTIFSVSSIRGWVLLLMAASLMTAPPAARAVGSWAHINNFPYSYPSHMLLLTDGSVMVQRDNSTTWYHLQPDSQGHYVQGNWSQFNGMTDYRRFYASQVLPNGNVIVAGGEFGDGGSTAELFSPLDNNGMGSWTDVTPPASPQLLGAFSDSSSIMLPNGAVAFAPVAVYDQNATNYYNTLLYYPASGTWSHVNYGSINYQDESTWLKLPDNTVLSADIFTGGTTSERFLTGPEIWIADANLPRSVSMEGGAGETGGAFMMANGQAFFLGGSGQTAFYTPTGTTNHGTWTQGPDMPFYIGTIDAYDTNNSDYYVTNYSGLLMAQDTPAAMLNNGKILCQFAANNDHAEVRFYEYDPSITNFVAAPCPTNATPGTPFLPAYHLCDGTSMLDLPDGTVLYSDTANLYVYTPDGSPLVAGRPTVQSVSLNLNGDVHLTGTLFNGISQGASYGDDAQQDSNYPLVRFTDGSGNVTYGRTYNWSSTGVQTGNQIVTTECTLPSNVLTNPGTTYSLQVVANGNASSPVTFFDPVWVDFNYSTNSPQIGTFSNPYSTLAQGTNAVPSGGTISIKAGHSPETMKISKPMKLIAIGGTAIIGQQ